MKMKWDKEIFSENIKYLYYSVRCEELNIKRDDFLEKTGLSVNTLYRLLRAEVFPKDSTVKKIAEAFNIPVESFNLPLSEFAEIYEIQKMAQEDYREERIQEVFNRHRLTENNKKYNAHTEKFLREYGVSQLFFHFLLRDTAFFHVKAPADGEAYPYHFKDDSGKIRDCVFHASDFIYIKMLQDTITSQIDDKKSTREGGGGTAVLL